MSTGVANSWECIHLGIDPDDTFTTSSVSEGRFPSCRQITVVFDNLKAMVGHKFCQNVMGMTNLMKLLERGIQAGKADLLFLELEFRVIYEVDVTLQHTGSGDRSALTMNI